MVMEKKTYEKNYGPYPIMFLPSPFNIRLTFYIMNDTLVLCKLISQEIYSILPYNDKN